ncbi:hypothetical protein GCM10025858_34330 [Alicyclobacillus sacchari]|nr:hypothetical protein GCM10025858_34330 [Alicyclobacillus sacchari]
MKTIRFLHPDDDRVHLGILEGDAVYSVTKRVPAWTEPIAMWHALRALDLSPRKPGRDWRPELACRLPISSDKVACCLPSPRRRCGRQG